MRQRRPLTVYRWPFTVDHWSLIIHHLSLSILGSVQVLLPYTRARFIKSFTMWERLIDFIQSVNFWLVHQIAPHVISLSSIGYIYLNWCTTYENDFSSFVFLCFYIHVIKWIESDGCLHPRSRRLSKWIGKKFCIINNHLSSERNYSSPSQYCEPQRQRNA